MRTPLQTMRVRTPLQEAHLAGQVGVLAPSSPLGGQYGRGVRMAATRMHQGWDLYASLGTTVHAIMEGDIEDIAQNGDYGLRVLLRFTHRSQTLYALHAHLASTFVRVGEHVREGQVLAVTGASGNAANVPPHLHFEIWTKPNPGSGLDGRIDPGEILGYHYLNLDLTHPRGETG